MTGQLVHKDQHRDHKLLSPQVKNHVVDTDVIYRRAEYVWQVLTKDSECTVTTMGKSIGIS